MRPLLSTALLLALLVPAQRAAAQPAPSGGDATPQVTAADAARAQALLDHGRALIEQGDIAAGCAKVEAGATLDSSSTALLALGDCLERRGATASAYGAFNRAARASGNPRTLGEAARRARAASARLYRIEIVASGVAGLRVELDGREVSPVELGTPIPVDPGEHTVAAIAPGKAAWGVTVSAPSDPGSSTVSIPALAERGPSVERRWAGLANVPRRKCATLIGPGTPECPGPERAPTPALARALVEEASALAKAGRDQEACARIFDSAQIDPAARTLLSLGDCFERRGATASAWGTFDRASTAAYAVNDATGAVAATERMRAIEPRLYKIELQVPRPPLRDLDIDLDRKWKLGPKVWGQGLPVDPVEHVITVTAEGHTPWVKRLPAPTSAGTVRIAIPVPAKVPPAANASDYSPGLPTSLVVVLSLGSVGIVSGIVGAGMLMSEGRKSRGVTTAGVTLLVAGGVLFLPLGIGAIAGLVEKNRTKTVQTPLPLRVSPMVAQGGGGLSLQLDF